MNLVERIRNQEMIYKDHLMGEIECWAKERLISDEQRERCLQGKMFMSHT